MEQSKFVDKVYKLTRHAAPLSFMLPTRNSRSFPLMHWDEETGVNRVLRYARNQNSPFEDEQDGNAIVEPVIFEDGFLSVPKQNQVLQKFLSVHPLNGKKFEEINTEADAKDDMESLNVEVDALIEARGLPLEQLEVVYRVIYGKDCSTLSTAELKRDVLVFAKNSPEAFLDVLDDPELNHNAAVQHFFDVGLLATRRNNTEVWFSTPTNKKKMLSCAYGQEPTTAVAVYLKSDKGLDALKMLESLTNK